MQGVVLYHDATLGLFVQVGQATVQVSGAYGGPFAPGDRVQMSGTPDDKDGHRTLAGATVTRLGPGVLPAAREIATSVLASDPSPDDWVQFEGVIQEVTPTASGFELRLAIDEAQVTILVPASAPQAADLVDAMLRIRGVRIVRRNLQGIVTGIRILAPSVAAGDIKTPPAGPPFELPLRSAADIRKIATRGVDHHRVHMRGTVLLQHTAVMGGRHIVHVQDGTGAMVFEVPGTVDVPPGTVVDITGFPGTFLGSSLMTGGVLRKQKFGPRPAAVTTTVADLMAGQHAGEFVRLRGVFRQYAKGPDFQTLTMDTGNTSVSAFVYDWPGHLPLPDVREGSTIDLTGVTAVFYDAVGAPTTMIMVIGGPDAIAIVQVPTWWTPLRLAVALGGAAGLCVLALLWIGVLNARVRHQTRALTAQFERTAALQQRWTDLVSTASDVIVTWDLDGRLTSVNKTGQAILGMPEDAALQRSLTDIVAPEAVDVADALIHRRSDDAPGKRIELEVVGAGGERTPLELNVQPMFENREHVGFQAIARDMTAHKRVERALRDARDAAEDANRAKSEFLANMSHEIRTPMNGVIGMTQLALMTDLSATQRDYLETVGQSAESLLGILNSILDFSKIESRKLEMESVPFELRDLIGETLKTLGVAAEGKGLELILDIAPDVPDAIVGDPLRLRQVVTNLVGNALKFTDQGHILLEVREDRRGEGQVMLHFSVSDTGVGIPKDKQPLIFAPFSQADGSTTRRYGGTGLGLAISASLVTLMGGRIWIDSAPDEGSTFHFLAGFGLVTDVQPAATDPYLDEMPALIVDDNSVNRRILASQIARLGMTTAEADGGAVAIEMLLAAAGRGRPYRLVLLDVHMPDVDGFGVATEISTRPQLAGTTVIMLTSAGRHDDVERCRALNIAAYLNKPISPTHLLDVVSSLFGRDVSAPVPVKGPAASVLPANRRRRVLLAEDNVVNQRVAVGLLSKRGHEIVVVGTGKEAIERLDHDTFDVILMDVQMPEMGGLEATGIIRRRELGTGRHAWIVAMTAHTMEGDRDECLAAGMDTYISKPVDPTLLFAAVERDAPLPAADAQASDDRLAPGDSLAEFAVEAPGGRGPRRA